MKSIVIFDFFAGIPVKSTTAYPSLDVIPKEEAGLWTGLIVKVEHDDDAGPTEVVESARQTVRDILSVTGVGRGLPPVLATAHVRSVTALPDKPTTGLAKVQVGGAIVRAIQTTPDEKLVRKVAEDPMLRRQIEALNAALADSDVVSRIRWSYMVLEQEQNRGRGYTPEDQFRHLRNGVSHPELTKEDGKAYFRDNLGVNFPDLGNPAHLEFLQGQAPELLKEAIRIVEQAFQGHKFWL